MAKKDLFPSFVQPMLATLTNKYFSSKEWIYEQKFDGERCIAIKHKGTVELLSRNRHEMNTGYPEIVAALIKQKTDNFIIDGEIVALDPAGVSKFELLQSRINLQNNTDIKQRSRQTPVYYRIFDIIYIDGYDVRNLPLVARKALLKKLLAYNRTLIFTQHRTPDGVKYLKEACAHHWEGIIAKKSDSIYVGRRSPAWLKFKCAIGQELVIAGFTDPHGSRTDFRALLVGYYDGKKLMYAGKVGTGFSEDILAMLGKKLRALEIKTCPFTNYVGSMVGIHWVKPKLVAEFKFAEWTKGGKLRVPRYQGLRDDKAAKDVIKEMSK